jgi:hypothetical protein
MSSEPGVVDPRAAPILVGIVYGSALIAAWGFTSLALDEDVVSRTDAGPLLGPSMAAAAIVSTILWLWGAFKRAGRGAILAAAGAAASAWFAIVIVAGVGYSVTRGDASWLLLLPASYAASAFSIAPALLAGATVWLSSWYWRRSLTAKPFDRDMSED